MESATNQAREKWNLNITPIHLVLQEPSYPDQNSLNTDGTDLNVLQQQAHFFLSKPYYKAVSQSLWSLRVAVRRKLVKYQITRCDRFHY